MEYGDVDGVGRFGILEVSSAGLLLCAECGWEGDHLGLHVYKASRVTAAAYRESHGLRRSIGLVSPALREQICSNAAAGLSRRPAFLEARDPAAALTARRKLSRSVSAEAAAARDTQMCGVGRRGRVVAVLPSEECGAVWCPLKDKRRRFCSYSCSDLATARRRGGTAS